MLAATDPAAVTLALFAGAGAALCVFAGAVTLWSGLAPDRSDAEAEAPRRAPVGAWMLVFALLLLLGQAVTRLGPEVAAVLLPPLHFFAALVPALALTGHLVWRLRLTRIVYGSCGAASVALVLEGLIAGGLLVLLLVVVARTAEGRGALSSLQESLASGSATSPPDTSELVTLLLQPVTVAAALLLFAVLGPIIEELAKVSGVALRTPTTVRQAWLQGVAIGAGFGLTEAIALGAAGVDGWPGAMMVRAAATLMHATMTGLASIGWFAFTRMGDRRLGAIGLLSAVVGHGAWNALVLVTLLAGASAASGGAPWLPAIAGASGAGLVLLCGAMVAAYAAIGLRLRPAT